MFSKTHFRKKYKIKRAALNEESIADLSMSIANQLLGLDIWDYSYYHLFLSITEKKEVDTEFILNILQGKDKNILISRSVLSSGKMNHFLLTDNTTIKKNSYNIPEPLDGIEVNVDQIEVVFVPLLTFDELGHRVGYGKGFYDSFLKECNSKTLKIGLSFFEAETKILDIHENDVKLDYCVTPSKIYSFSN